MTMKVMYGVFLEMDENEACSPGGDLLAIFENGGAANDWASSAYKDRAYVQEVRLHGYDKILRQVVTLQ